MSIKIAARRVVTCKILFLFYKCSRLTRSPSHFIRLRHIAAQNIQETAPIAITPRIKQTASELGSESLSFVPVVADKYGLFGWCADGVQEKIKNDGGTIVFGWCFWEYRGLFLTAEFHAVWSYGDKLLDITPKPQDEKSILFLPDRTYPSDFDFDNRPMNKRWRLGIGAASGSSASFKF